MENIFLQYDKENNYWRNSESYEVKKFYEFLKEKVTDLESYKKWVHQWKIYEKQYAESRRFLRKMRNELKKSVSDPVLSGNNNSTYPKYLKITHTVRKARYAQLIYNYRVYNKKIFQEYILPKIEV